MNTKVDMRRGQLIILLCFIAIVALLTFASLDSLMQMEHAWGNKEEYGYAYMIPLIVGFFIWQRKSNLLKEPMSFSWTGSIVLVIGIAFILLGTVSATHSIIQYAFFTALIGAVFQFIGWKAFKQILAPMLMLFLMIPLPAFLYNNLSAELQLISSRLGVWLIRLFDISVYLEGNVIDLGVYKLQVVEACSGLRYLFPLFSLSVIAAYVYRAETWKRIVIILSSVPITILMNSFRIGFIGVLVEYWGIEQAEGFLHDFEGWIIFMACTGLLILEMWVLAGIGKNKKKLSEVFEIEIPSPLSNNDRRNLPRFSPSYLVVTGFVILAVLSITVLDEREEVVPARKTFAEFPLRVSDWVGEADRMEAIYLDRLKLDDYILMNYRNGESSSINFYAAYYGSQRTGVAAHSPRSCLPGAGWKMEEFSQVDIGSNDASSGKLRVNRVIIKKGEYVQLVYYWFQQRGRIITNEYTVKWYLFLDALARGRTDGALVRLTTLVKPGQDVKEADKRLAAFAGELVPILDQYIPN